MYKALYRTYRPQIFEDVIGQDNIIIALHNAIKNNKLSHSYLFSGRSGTGKTTVAKIFAKAVNCNFEKVPCNSCKTCQLINETKTIDVMEIDGASNNGVSEIRNLIENIQYPTTVCQYKVYIIDEVHMLSSSAFNALLKTLEEPPENVIFILATTEEHKIPETILTRCQRFNFKKVIDKEVAQLISKILVKENKKFDHKAIELLASMANGGVRRALSLLEQCLSYDGKLTIDTIHKAYGLLSTAELIELINLVAKNAEQEVIIKINDIKERGLDYQRLFDEILILLKDIIIYQNTQDVNLTSLLNNENKELIKLDTDFIFKIFSKIRLALSDLRFSANPHIIFELTLLELTSLAKSGDNKENTMKLLAKEEIILPKQENINTNILETKNIKEKEVIKIDSISQKIKEDEDIDGKSLVTSDVVTAKVSELENSLFGDFKKNVLEKEKIIMPKIKINSSKETNHRESSEQGAETVELTKIFNKEIIKLNSEIKGKEIAGIEFDQIQNILVYSKRNDRDFYHQKWPELKKYLADYKTAKWASMLLAGKVVAASENAAIILFEYEPSANILNSKNMDKEFNDFSYKLFGKSILFVGVYEEKWIEDKNKYMENKQAKTLPKPVPIVPPKFKFEDETVASYQETKDLFGNIVEIK